MSIYINIKKQFKPLFMPKVIYPPILYNPLLIYLKLLLDLLKDPLIPHQKLPHSGVRFAPTIQLLYKSKHCVLTIIVSTQSCDLHNAMLIENAYAYFMK